MTRLRSLRTASIAAAALLGAAVPALGQDIKSFPLKPITLICPFPAGGASDIILRALAEPAGRHLGQPVIVDNKPGATGTLGPATMAATAKPDGYTISAIPPSMVRVQLLQKTSYDSTKDFAYIIRLTGFTAGITTNASSAFKTWTDVVAFAKANPGKVSYATPGAGSSFHIGMELIAAHDGIQLTHVPFKGGAETVAALLGGHVTLQADTTTWRPLVEAGQLRLLAVWTVDRVPAFKDVPTLKELGYPMEFEASIGLAGPKGMEAAVVTRLHDAFKKALVDPGVRATIAKHDMPLRYMDTAAYQAFMRDLLVTERADLQRIGLLKKE